MQDHSASNNTIGARIDHVNARIQQACVSSQRSPDTVGLLAVSKRQPAAHISQAYTFGLRHFGENIAQEAVDKIGSLSLSGCSWHFIGRLQSNKIKLIARYFDWVQTVTSTKQLIKLADCAQQFDKHLQICLQVKVGDEANKGGISIEDIPALVEQAKRCRHVSLRGVMAIPPRYSSEADWRQGVAPMLTCYHHLADTNSAVDTLSLGMSGDLEWAIASGSTMVRIGSALFGPRL